MKFPKFGEVCDVAKTISPLQLESDLYFHSDFLFSLFSPV